MPSPWYLIRHVNWRTDEFTYYSEKETVNGTHWTYLKSEATRYSSKAYAMKVMVDYYNRSGVKVSPLIDIVPEKWTYKEHSGSPLIGSSIFDKVEK